MDEPNGDEDGWVVARIAALERGNRRLWVALGALGMTLVSLAIAAGLVATKLEVPGTFAASSGEGGGAGGKSLVADDVTVRGAIRIVDDAGRSLVFIGRESVEAGGSPDANQAVIGLFASKGSDLPEQTIRIATSPAGSALSLGTPDGGGSVSIFASESSVSVDLRKGDKTHTLSERAENPLAPPPQAVSSEGPRAETPTATIRATGDATRGVVVDLSDPTQQTIGDGFSVVGLTLHDESGVLRLRGRLVNSTNVDQLRAEFRLAVAGRELQFSVARIAAGGTTPFTLELPPAKYDALRSARFRFVRSTASYSDE